MKIFFSVGEPSGDLHGANLIRQLREQFPEVQCVGYGGPRMAAAGCELHADLTQLAVMWFLRVITNIHKFLDLASRADRFFRHGRPDAVVLIDYPGFNFWIADRARQHGIPVFYYGTPQVWAWRQSRVKKMRRLIDHALCKLPFEEKWLGDRGVNATFLGHPYFDEMEQQRLDHAFVLGQQAKPGRLVTILPGSRSQEVGANLPLLLKSAANVQARMPEARFAVASFNEKQAAMARSKVAASRVDAEVHAGRTPELIHLAECCMACSGSVSLELLHRLKPTVIQYKISPAAYEAQKWFRKVRYITLVNLLSVDDPFANPRNGYEPHTPGHEKVLFPEYLTCLDRSDDIAGHIIEWLSHEDRRQALIGRLAMLKARVAHGGASRSAAAYILRELSPAVSPVRQLAA